MAQLVALGDSLTQGFHSGAIFNTTWSYPAIIARSLGLDVLSDDDTLPTGALDRLSAGEYRVPAFPNTGLPINIEAMLHAMRSELGDDISLGEWILRFPQLFLQFMDQVEDSYERGPGAAPSTFTGVYHNLAVWGFRVADVYRVSSAYARSIIDREEGARQDDRFGLPSSPMYRTAIRVLNPAQQAERDSWTMLDNLKRIVDEDGVENLIIWIGSNDCLGTVLNLELKDMPGTDVPSDPHARREWNLTHPTIFRQDFMTLAKRVSQIIKPETRVFVGTIPHVIIPPVTRGIGDKVGKYFRYYGRFFAGDKLFLPWVQKHLTRQQAIDIDLRIDTYNQTINEVVAQQGEHWHVVEVGQLLDELAVKRNNLEDDPARALQNYYEQLGMPDHPLLQLRPSPSVLRLGTGEQGQRRQGGLFSLDCFHPSTIGYGMAAEAFLRKMQEVGVPGANSAQLPWQDIIQADTLVHQAPALWDDVVEAAQHNQIEWDFMFRWFSAAQ